MEENQTTAFPEIDKSNQTPTPPASSTSNSPIEKQKFPRGIIIVITILLLLGVVAFGVLINSQPKQQKNTNNDLGGINTTPVPTENILSTKEKIKIDNPLPLDGMDTQLIFLERDDESNYELSIRSLDSTQYKGKLVLKSPLPLKYIGNSIDKKSIYFSQVIESKINTGELLVDVTNVYKYDVSSSEKRLIFQYEFENKNMPGQIYLSDNEDYFIYKTSREGVSVYFIKNGAKKIINPDCSETNTDATGSGLGSCAGGVTISRPSSDGLAVFAQDFYETVGGILKVNPYTNIGSLNFYENGQKSQKVIQFSKDRESSQDTHSLSKQSPGSNNISLFLFGFDSLYVSDSKNLDSFTEILLPKKFIDAEWVGDKILFAVYDCIAKDLDPITNACKKLSVGLNSTQNQNFKPLYTFSDYDKAELLKINQLTIIKLSYATSSIDYEDGYMIDQNGRMAKINSYFGSIVGAF